MKNVFFIILFPAVILSCEQTLTDFEVPDKAPKLVIHGRFFADSICRVNISKSLSFNDELEYIPVEDAIIRLFKEQLEMGNFEYQSEGWYLKSGIGLSGPDDYRLEVSANGFNDAHTYFSIPDKPKYIIEEPEVTMEFNSDFYNSSSPIYSLIVDIIIEDNEEVDNYYRLEALCNDMSYYYNPDLSETKVNELNLEMMSQNPVIEVVEDGDYMLNNPEYNDTGESFIFSDLYFNGERFTIRVYINIGPILTIDSTFGRDYKIWLRLSETDENYYQYAKNRARINQTTWILLIEPVTVYTSVKNGFGIVYGMNFEQDTLNLLEIEPSLDTIYLDRYSFY